MKIQRNGKLSYLVTSCNIVQLIEENIDESKAMNTVVQCTTGHDPQCKMQVHNVNRGGGGGERQVRRIDNG